MYNTQKPNMEDLPSTGQLLRSTFIAFISAMVILVTIVLPAEYAIDPTGIGRIIGLTEMGEIKTQLEKEAEEDRKKDAAAKQQSFLFKLFIGTAHAEEAKTKEENWRDEKSFTLKPGKGIEWKLVMKKGQAIEYKWRAENGRINYDFHGDGVSGEVSYEKGRGKKGAEGAFTAPRDGKHGWFWRNRDKKDVTVKLQIRGDYNKLIQTY